MNIKDFTNKGEETTISKKVSSFLSKHRILLVSIPAILIIIAAVYGILNFANTSITKKDFQVLDSIVLDLEKSNELTEAELEETIFKVKENLNDFVAKKTKGAASARAFMAIAGIEFEAKQFQEAKEAYIKAAKANEKAYTASVAYYNAAIAAEENGELSSALDLLGKIENAKDFALLPQALFNMGRIALDLEEKDVAKKYFQKLVEKFPTDSWANLAKTQLISLEIIEKE